MKVKVKGEGCSEISSRSISPIEIKIRHIELNPSFDWLNQQYCMQC